MTGQETRNKLTDYWKESGVEKQDEFALLTNIIHQEWTGLTVKKHKDLIECCKKMIRCGTLNSYLYLYLCFLDYTNKCKWVSKVSDSLLFVQYDEKLLNILDIERNEQELKSPIKLQEEGNGFSMDLKI